jgi:pSer/pThr/pTyr-binding forkhead associated (FHA) protein
VTVDRHRESLDMSAKIQVIVGPDRGRTFAVAPNGTLNIGRSHTTDTQLTDAAVSRLHCRIEFDGRTAVLFNVSSKGTKVNDTPAAQQELHHGDLIRIGDTEMRFALAALAEAETLLQPGTLESVGDPPEEG